MNSYAIDRQKWATLSIFEQMGNVGAEVGRALRARRMGDDMNFQGALQRGLDLFDATAEVWAAKRSPRVKEVLRAREQFASAALGEGRDDALERYFMQFAVAGRLRR